MIGAEAASGRFEVLSRIAAGGMGEVYRARMSSGGGATKQVALKVVLDEHAGDPQYAEMLIAEAKVAMGLSHANVVQAFDAGRLGERFFLAMEFVDGATVRDLLRRQRGPIPEAQAVTIAVEGLKGLDYAHRFRDPDTGEQLDIVHRDVSPHADALANIAAVPATLNMAFSPAEGASHHLELLIGVLTLVMIVLWRRYKPRALAICPGALPAVIGATVVVVAAQMPVGRVVVPESLASTLTFPSAASLALGNETEGVSASTEPLVDEWLRIPMAREGDSLNVAAAATVVAYEIVRRTQ